jgi:hypothetical protein
VRREPGAFGHVAVGPPRSQVSLRQGNDQPQRANPSLVRALAGTAASRTGVEDVSPFRIMHAGTF